MKICTPHGDALRRALERRDLWKLVKQGNREEIAERGARWLAGDLRGKRDYCPYVIAWLEINQKASEVLHPSISSSPHLCPLCQVDRKVGRPMAQAWIDRICDLVLDLTREAGLISGELVIVQDKAA
jgi:hypothetical protein